MALANLLLDGVSAARQTGRALEGLTTGWSLLPDHHDVRAVAERESLLRRWRRDAFLKAHPGVHAPPADSPDYESWAAQIDRRADAWEAAQAEGPHDHGPYDHGPLRQDPGDFDWER